MQQRRPSATSKSKQKIHPCCSIFQYFILFYGQIMIHCMDIPHFVYPLIDIWVVSLFGYYEFMLILKLVYKYLSESLFSNPWGYILRSRIAGSYGNSLFNILGSAKLFHIPTSKTQGLRFLPVLTTLVALWKISSP